MSVIVGDGQPRFRTLSKLERHKISYIGRMRSKLGRITQPGIATSQKLADLPITRVRIGGKLMVKTWPEHDLSCLKIN